MPLGFMLHHKKPHTQKAININQRSEANYLRQERSYFCIIRSVSKMWWSKAQQLLFRRQTLHDEMHLNPDAK